MKNPDSLKTNAPSRRTVAAGIAWTLPAVAIAAAAPQAVASDPVYVPCAFLPQNVGTWERTSSRASGLSGCGNTMYAECDDTYYNLCDNAGDQTAWVKYTSVVTNLEPNTLYQFVFTTKAGAGCPDPNDSRRQGIDLQIDGQMVWAGQTAGITNTAGPSNPDLFAGAPVSAVNLTTHGKTTGKRGSGVCPDPCTTNCDCDAPVCCARPQQWIAQWCSGEQTSAVIAFEYLIAAGGEVDWNDDIGVTTPLIACVGAC